MGRRGAAAEWSALRSLPLTHDVALGSERLAGVRSQDPADRFLVSTALEHQTAFITADQAIQAFAPLRTIW